MGKLIFAHSAKNVSKRKWDNYVLLPKIEQINLFTLKNFQL
nr:MAG TPA: hypothetical protein [Caudoviricetes sp.]